MKQLVNNWRDLSKCESSKYRIVLEDNKCSAWIEPKKETIETKENYFEHHQYLSTHSFYGDTYRDTNNLLKKFGFDVEVVSWD